MQKRNKKICMLLMGLITCISLVACGKDNVQKNIDSGKEALNNKEYSKAEEDFNNVLNEDSQNKEAKILLDIIQGYYKAKKSYEESDLKSASEEIDKLSSEYNKYPIKDDINKLKNDIESKKSDMDNINKNIQYIKNLVKSERFNEAKNKFNEIISNNNIKISEDEIKELQGLVTKNLDEFNENKEYWKNKIEEFKGIINSK